MLKFCSPHGRRREYKVNPGSKAATRGIREGDIITSINGQSTKDKTNAEAHLLLKNAGEVLKLGLNEEGVSPKKRQYRTIQQQETHTSETTKRTNSTIQVVTTTKETHIDHKSAGNNNGLEEKNTKINGSSHNYQGQDCFSEKSTISSNYSSPASTPSTLTDTQGGDRQQELRILTMPDTRRKRRRNGKKKNRSEDVTKENGIIEEVNEEIKKVINGDANKNEIINNEVITNETIKNEIIKNELIENELNQNINDTIKEEITNEENYRVESPRTIQIQNGKRKGQVVKSKSLDDDDIKIQEISSETCESNDVIHTMTTETLEMDSNTDEFISAEDESKLRCFLEGLNLQTTPDDERKDVKESSEIIKAKRLKKREELAQYFLPVYQNPRFLDVISEENSDQSDKEIKEIKERSKPKIFPFISSNHKKVETVMVEREDVALPLISDTCTISMAQSSEGVEVVFLDDDSEDEIEIPSSQLTPPPTPDEDSDLEEPVQAMKTSSCLTPKPSRSPSYDREDSSSRGTSLCTTINTSLNIKSLRELCLDKLVSLPFGEDVLEELAKVSMSLQELTNNMPNNVNKNETLNNSNFGIAEKNMKNKPEEKWVGLPIEENPNVIICLSPTQKQHLDNSKIIKNEADNLLDLHNKFYERAYYSDTECDFTLKSKSLINPRLQAKNLSEWLELAKTSQLSQNKTNISQNITHTYENIPHISQNKPQNVHQNTPQNTPQSTPQPRRRSLPNEIYVQQMQSIIEKEKEIQRELEKLEFEKRKLQNEIQMEDVPKFDPTKYHISKNEDIAILNEELKRPQIKLIQPSTENFRKQMYNEYLQQIAERQERKQQKVIKISSRQDLPEESHQCPGIKDEFMSKLKQKRYCHRNSDEDTGDNSEPGENGENGENYENSNEINKVMVIDGKTVSDSKKLPKHLKEFVDITRQAAENLHLENENPDEPDGSGIWTPGQRDSFSGEDLERQPSTEDRNEEPIAPVWTPKSAGSSPQLERKEFRPVNFNSPVLSRKNQPTSPTHSSPSQIEPPWKNNTRELSQTLQKRIPNSQSAPSSGFSDFSQAPRLPRAQNPTITLLQKAREGQLPKGASYIEEQPPLPPRRRESPPKINPGEIVYEIKNEYTSESESERPKRIADLGPRKFPGIGPTTQDGMPLTLRSEVRDQNQSKWYKKMYDTIHKQKPRYDDDYVTIRYKHRRGRYPYTSGYVSEPEPGAYDSDTGFYHPATATLDRRRPQDKPDDTFIATYTMPRSIGHSYSLQSDVIKHGKDVYKNQPGRIENYIPGHSSISEKEAKEWWDEVMDIFDGHLEQQKHIPSKGYMSQALKESGYESDSTLVFRRREDAINQLSPSQQKEAYRTIQKGGDVPLHGLRKPAPERPKESPRKYVENEVTIHYKTPVRQEVKEALSEDELQRRQAEHMKKVYQEERRRKYLQVSQSVDHIDELQDMNSRRHTDNFIPSQKSPIPLNRYDDFIDDYSPKLKPRPRSPEPRLVAKALYNFVGQTARELTFRKGDIIYIRRQIDKNWYEGEHNAMVGLFPANYVEIVPYDGLKSTTRKSHEGQARAKYNFIAQTHLELSLAKGELVVITRKVDDNWFEGKIGGRKGIFPVSYVEVLIDPSDPPQVPSQSKPVAAPAAHSLLLNGSLSGKESMGAHNYVPINQSSSQSHHQNGFNTNSESNRQNLTQSYHAKPIQITGNYHGKKNPLNQELHVDTHSEPYVPYRALYKYKPQNEDEIELNEGDTVYVLEKCDDGWFVGASDRTGALGTFPGNYVERI